MISTRRRLGHSDIAWLSVFGHILALELIARDGELLSEAADRYMRAHPWITRIAVYGTAVHLTNQIPEKMDPWMLVVRTLRFIHHHVLGPVAHD